MGSCNGMAFFPSSFMVQNSSHRDQEDHHHHPPTSFNSVLPSSFTSLQPVDFHGTGVTSLPGKKTSSMAFTGFDVCDHHQENNNGEEDYSDDGSQMGENKRRLNMEQVKTLEKNFELGNKLEPERKMQLARALGLQPRQIAIWFQNRRAIWKTKSLEKDYDILKRQFDAVKADNEALQSQNKKLRDESVHRTSYTEIIWLLFVLNTFKLNCDASWISATTNAGYGIIIRNWTCTLKEKILEVSKSAEEADAIALLQAVKWAKEKNTQNLVIKGTINQL
ncbi:hypothetical protein MKW92_049770 [Papaver armeniacum]|nr:hypothetical protein MKW92_049770 [Papaver armeniacum]